MVEFFMQPKYIADGPMQSWFPPVFPKLSHLFWNKFIYHTNVIARRFVPKQSPVLRDILHKGRLPRRQNARSAARNDIIIAMYGREK